ncbi:MAG: hypothetical protein AAGJ96_08335 [Pseudomonadota bacterium]
MVDPRKGMQGYLSSEPYAVANTEGGFEPNVFLIADAGYSTYATMIETMQPTIDERPEVVECFVDASIKGWYNYLYNDNAAANALIMEANPDMTQDKIDFAIASMIENGIVISGKAEELGIGAMSADEVGEFYQKMVDAGVLEDGINWRAAFNASFVNNGVGMDLLP